MIDTRSSRRTVRRTIAVCAVAALAVTACSKSTASGGSGGAAKGGGTGDIHVTVLGSYTGAYAQIGTALYNGAAAGAATVNAGGGINGRKLVLDKVDTKGDPADAVPVFQQELATHHPVAVIGPTTLEIFGIQPIVDRNKIPDFFNGGSTAFDKNTDPWVWRINPSDSQLALALALQARAAGINKAAILFTSEASQQSLEPFLKNDFTKLGGTVTTVVNVTPGVSSYNSEIVGLLASHPQAILGQLDPPTAATFFSQLRTQVGTTMPFYGTDVTAGADWIKAVGASYAHAAVTSVQGGTPTNAAGDAFAAQYKALFNDQPLGGANYTYDGVIDLALSITAGKSTTPADITANLPSVSNPPATPCFTYASCVSEIKSGGKSNYEGASGPMDFDPNHNVSGPWDVVKADDKGNLKTITTITAAAVSAAESKVQ
ncbi:ABC transporter substrate-binding protein [Jatrophihabitans telluris]|uniref:ABC transporter substrate-binding protein n=1 Tax=Jatrophihabitans telluris TaxID=2038343 RepID=A0ABY4R1F8_9ACTN|nr:ABC transporter substrate-binding protein [Jatrophihabitans telluris]UQX88965.1 ABC transporter substrate-binding protein [Jatrophihabitans telluris]